MGGNIANPSPRTQKDQSSLSGSGGPPTIGFLKPKRPPNRAQSVRLEFSIDPTDRKLDPRPHLRCLITSSDQGLSNARVDVRIERQLDRVSVDEGGNSILTITTLYLVKIHKFLIFFDRANPIEPARNRKTLMRNDECDPFRSKRARSAVRPRPRKIEAADLDFATNPRSIRSRCLDMA